MNGFVIVVVGLALVVALLRLWFRWFSRRPLSTTDDYAVTVDTAIDDASGTSAATPPALAAGAPLTPPPPGPVPGRPSHGSFIPRQRSASDDRSGADPAPHARPDDRPARVDQ